MLRRKRQRNSHGSLLKKFQICRTMCGFFFRFVINKGGAKRRPISHFGHFCILLRTNGSFQVADLSAFLFAFLYTLRRKFLPSSLTKKQHMYSMTLWSSSVGYGDSLYIGWSCISRKRRFKVLDLSPNYPHINHNILATLSR